MTDPPKGPIPLDAEGAREWWRQMWAAVGKEMPKHLEKKYDDYGKLQRRGRKIAVTMKWALRLVVAFVVIATLLSLLL